MLECGPCKICVARSILEYPFKRDLATSEDLVNELIKHINDNTQFQCRRPGNVKYPDIEVWSDSHGGHLICRVEAKMLEGYAFMKAAEKLTDSLKPKETLVVDAPKLRSYFSCKAEDLSIQHRDIPIFVVWKFDRPCADVGGITVFQEVSELRTIYENKGISRAFERKTVATDMFNGKKYGITAKYHFSLRECKPIEQLIPAILFEGDPHRDLQ